MVYGFARGSRETINDVAGGQMPIRHDEREHEFLAPRDIERCQRLTVTSLLWKKSVFYNLQAPGGKANFRLPKGSP